MRSALLLALLPLAACQTRPADTPPTAPALTSRADTLAWQAYEAMGGPAVWDHVRFVRFDFGSEQDGQVAPNRRRHLWNRQTGDYRMEFVRGDSVYVVLFNTQTKEGTAFQSPSRTDTSAVAPVDTSRTASWVDRAYRAFINDTYWLLQPAKLFDPGVTRTFEADSSTAARPVLRLSFENVGLTPGDRYWLYFEDGAALPAAWRYHLEGSDAAGALIRSSAPKTIPTPHGTATLRERHTMETGRAVLTDHAALPDSVDVRLFTNPRVLMVD